MIRSIFCVFFVVCISISCSPKTSVDLHAEVLNGKWMSGLFIQHSQLFFLVGQQGAIVYSSDGEDWEQAPSPVTNTLSEIAVGDFNTLIVVGEKGVVLRSSDGGKSWKTAKVEKSAELGMQDVDFSEILYLPKSKVWLIGGTKSTILRSRDDGKHWQVVSFNDGNDQREILDLFVEENTGQVFFAAQYGAMGKSNDAGLTWNIEEHALPAEGNYIPNIVSFHQFDHLLIATADNGHLLLSENFGQSWELQSVAVKGYFTDAAFDKKHKTIVLTTQTGDIVFSEDFGKKWNVINLRVNNWPGDETPLLAKVLYDDVTKSLLVLGNSGVIARSVNGGRSWYSDIYKPFVNLSITTLVANAEKGLYIGAGMGGAIARSLPLGFAQQPLENWELIRPGIDQYVREVINLPESNVFVAVGQLGGIWRSEDDGKNWQLIDVKYPLPNQPPHLRDIVYDQREGALIAAGPTASIVRSTDGGLSWSPVFQGPSYKGEAFTQILHDKKNNTYLACEVLYRSVYRSTDSGKSWDKIATIQSGDRNLWHGAISEALSTIIVVGQGGGIAMSHDAGESWEMARLTTFGDLYGAFSDDELGILLAVGDGGVIYRSENGRSWNLVNSGTESTLRRVAKDKSSGALIAFGQEGTVLRSTDAGLSWNSVGLKQYKGELRDYLFEENNQALILVGKDGGILRSVDSGQTWSLLRSHTTQHLRSVAQNPKTGTLISVGDGLIRLSRKG